MANDDKIEIEIVLDDGSIKKGFANIRKQGKKTAKKTGDDFDVFVNKKFGSGIFQVRSQLLALGAGIAAAFAGFKAFDAAIEASNRQADAILNLNTQLKLAGEFSETASMGVQAFASEIQNVTRFGDEAVIEVFNLARTFGRSNIEAQKLTKAAIELSAATGIDVNSAVRNLGKSFSGLLGELGELVPATRDLTTEQLKAGAALDFVQGRFGGAAAANVENFSGRLDQLSNAWGDLLEGIGDFITKSPAANKLIDDLAFIVSKLAQNAKDAAIEDFGGGLELAAVRAKKLEAELRFAEGRLETTNKQLKNGGGLLQKFISERQTKSVAVLRNELNKVNAQLEKFTILQTAGGNATKKVVADLTKFNETLRALSLQRIEGEKQAAQKSLQGEAQRAQIRALNLEKIKLLEEQFLADQKEINAKFSEDTGFSEDQRAMLILQKRQALNAQIAVLNQETVSQQSNFLESVSSGLKGSFEDSAKAIATLGKTVGTTLRGGIVNSISAFGAALAKGENGLDAFAKSILGTFGEIAIQMGTFMIFSGLGLPFLPGMQQAAGSVPFGVALVALGGALKSLSGGGSSAPAAGGGAAATGGSTEFGGAGEVGIDAEDISEQQGINVTIQGDVLDSAETGTRIAQIIGEHFDTTGEVLNVAVAV